MRLTIALLFFLAGLARADDMALRCEAGRFMRGVPPSPETWFFDDGWMVSATGRIATVSQLDATTNTPAFLAWLAAQPGPAPAQFPDGIEAPLMILTSQTNGWGIGIMAADDGTLLTYTDHQSPRPAATKTARRQAAALSAYTNKVAGLAVQRANSRKPNITQAEKINVLWETYKLEHP